jgi:hypothetical protein
MKKILFFLFFTVSINTQAQPEVVAHFNFGRTGNITFSAAQAEISDPFSRVKLRAIGQPVFYADAPSHKAQSGEGSIRFNGKDDGYAASQAFGKPDDNMILEVWVKALTLDHGDDHPGQLRPVVSNGNIREGYTIAQQGSQWVFVSGGSGISTIGNVVKDMWVHLAAVKDGNDNTLWVNGKKTGTFNNTGVYAERFSVATAGYGHGPFNGEVNEVRYSTFKKGKFNPNTHFLLDYEYIKKVDDKRIAERIALIRDIESPGKGKEIVDSLSLSVQSEDWLINNIEETGKLLIEKSKDGITSMFQLNNGLVSRTFFISDNLACVSFNNLSNGAEYIRAVKPEVRIMLDSVWYEAGGLKGQPENSYLLDSWYSQLESNPNAFRLAKLETGLPIERYPWEHKFNAAATPWPPKGLRLTMTFTPTEFMKAVKDIEVKVNYEIYDGIPVISKWMEVTNSNDENVRLNSFESEVLAITQDQVNRIHVESDYSFALVNWDKDGSGLLHFVGEPKPYQAGQSTTKWVVDPEYHTWATQNAAEDIFLDFPHRNLLLSKLPMGPDVMINREDTFTSNVTFELLNDSDDRERQSLGVRRMYKKLAPQVTESLIGASITSHDETKLKFLIDQMYDLGMEKLTIDPWPGISYDNMDEDYLSHWKKIGQYAKERGIVMAGYELQVASRGRGAEVDCIDPVSGNPGTMFGQSVCIASKWQDDYYPKMWRFYEESGFMVYSADGPYHGDACGSAIHKHHRGLEDSQWEQWKVQVDVIHEAQRRGMNVPLPDWYFLNGQSSTGMGYREATANLSPEQQLLLGRQYIYDGTWYKLPTMGWMTLQLVGFYTNDLRVGLEPLSENIKRYEQQLIQYLASGCQLTIRGNRMYDTPETKAIVSKWLNWFKEYRDILTSDIIHVSRPTGRDLDCMMHVNPFIDKKGMVIVFNPTDREIEKELKLPLYYSGLKENVIVKKEGGDPVRHDLNEKSELLLPVKVKAQGTSWFVLELY